MVFLQIDAIFIFDATGAIFASDAYIFWYIFFGIYIFLVNYKLFSFFSTTLNIAVLEHGLFFTSSGVWTIYNNTVTGYI